MKNISRLCLILCCFYLFGCRQAKPYNPAEASAALKTQVTSMAQALVKADYKTFCHYAYPKLLVMVGGEGKMTQMVKESMDKVGSQGIKITGFTYEEPGKAYNVGKVWQSTIVQHTAMSIPNGKVTTTSTLIAFSSDNGQNWTFIDTSNKSEADVRKLVPDLSPSIVIPPTQDPVVTPQ